MTFQLQELETGPPPPRYRTSAIGEAEARQALTILETQTWVSEKETTSTRPASAARARRLIHHMNKLEPKSEFTSKTWPEGKRFRWGVRRKGTQ